MFHVVHLGLPESFFLFNLIVVAKSGNFQHSLTCNFSFTNFKFEIFGWIILPLQA